MHSESQWLHEEIDGYYKPTGQKYYCVFCRPTANNELFKLNYHTVTDSFNDPILKCSQCPRPIAYRTPLFNCQSCAPKVIENEIERDQAIRRRRELE